MPMAIGPAKVDDMYSSTSGASNLPASSFSIATRSTSRDRASLVAEEMPLLASPISSILLSERQARAYRQAQERCTPWCSSRYSSASCSRPAGWPSAPARVGRRTRSNRAAAPSSRILGSHRFLPDKLLCTGYIWEHGSQHLERTARAFVLCGKWR